MKILIQELWLPFNWLDKAMIKIQESEPQAKKRSQTLRKERLPTTVAGMKTLAATYIPSEEFQ